MTTAIERGAFTRWLAWFYGGDGCKGCTFSRADLYAAYLAGREAAKAEREGRDYPPLESAR